MLFSSVLSTNCPTPVREKTKLDASLPYSAASLYNFTGYKSYYYYYLTDLYLSVEADEGRGFPLIENVHFHTGSDHISLFVELDEAINFFNRTVETLGSTV